MVLTVVTLLLVLRNYYAFDTRIAAFHININKRKAYTEKYYCMKIIYFYGTRITKLDRMSSIYSHFVLNFNEITSLINSIRFDTTHGISVPITDKKRRHSTMKRKIKASFYK